MSSFSVYLLQILIVRLCKFLTSSVEVLYCSLFNLFYFSFCLYFQWNISVCHQTDMSMHSLAMETLELWPSIQNMICFGTFSALLLSKFFLLIPLPNRQTNWLITPNLPNWSNEASEIGVYWEWGGVGCFPWGSYLCILW